MGEVSSSSLEAAEFLRHADFVRRLARRLAADEAAAEDLVQDTWLAALEHPPTQARGVRAWLARVLRNQAALRRRTGARRVHRERAVARVDRAPETGELIERMELHRRVVAAMLALPEPYRDVIVRRFSQEETPAEIAARLGVPEPTVRTRLRRGLERLRLTLRVEHGGSSALFLTSLQALAGESVALG